MATTILVLSIFFILSSIPISSFSCPLHQKEALVHFKHNLNTILNSSSIDVVSLKSWNPDSNCCTWDHVTCDTASNVVKLDLSMVLLMPDTLITLFSDILTPLFHIRSLKLLDISRNELLGQIPKDGFRNLTELVQLRMSFNRFTGSIPCQLLQLSNLQVLDLSFNAFEGPIPPQLFQLKSLQILDLGDNRFSSGIPASIINMKELEFLDLSGNSLSMEIPAYIGRLPNIKTLDLSNNQFTGPIPSSIHNLSKLNTLRLWHNKLTGDIPTWLFNITTLRYLLIGGKGSNLIWNNKPKIVPRCSLIYISMTYCGIYGQIPEWISSQRDLELLDLSMNQLEGPFPNWLVEKDISCIILSDNKFTGSIPSRLFESEGLQILALARNNFSGELPNNIGNAGEMMILVLSGNSFSGSIPMSMSNMSSLLVLDMSRNKFSGSSFPVFRETIGTYYFDFSFNDFFGNIPTSFPIYTQVLSLGGNRFSGELPLNLTKLVDLKKLDLHDNDIKGNFQDVLPQFPNLQILNLRKNSFEGFIPRTISNLVFLQILDISENNLNGSIPQEIANLEGMIETPNTTYTPFYIDIYRYNNDDFNDAIEFHDLIVNWKNSFQALPSHTIGLYSLLDLSDNKLSGEIPASLGNLKGLKTLNISHNIISRHIPMSFGDLKHIESLDLSHNKITGSIPQSLAKLEELSTLDVSNNRLTGKIPMGGQMNTMDEPKSYANNNGLCGMQMKVTCPEDIPPTPTKGSEDEEEDKILSLVFSEGTCVGFPVGLFSSILIIGYFLDLLQHFKLW